MASGWNITDLTVKFFTRNSSILYKRNIIWNLNVDIVEKNVKMQIL